MDTMLAGVSMASMLVEPVSARVLARATKTYSELRRYHDVFLYMRLIVLTPTCFQLRTPLLEQNARSHEPT